MSDVFEHLDEVMERLTGLRDELLADPAAANRSTRLAAVFETEARTWPQLYELSSLRLVAGGAGRRGRCPGERAAVGAAGRRRGTGGWRPRHPCVQRRGLHGVQFLDGCAGMGT
jgi:hypothetical protein